MTYVSYSELSLAGGKLFGSLGAGSVEEILSRSHTDPSIRVCMQEPAGGVMFRARCGVVELTSSGLVDISQHDATQQRGAWVQLLPISQRIWAWLRRNEATNTPLSMAIASGWLEAYGDRMEPCDAERAWNVMSDPSRVHKPPVLVRFGGRHVEIARALALLGDELDLDNK